MSSLSFAIIYHLLLAKRFAQKRKLDIKEKGESCCVCLRFYLPEVQRRLATALFA